MTDCKDLKRNFQDLVAELESSGYLKPEDPSVRYQRIRQGVWRVNLELHPDQLRTKGRSAAAPPQAKPPKAPPAGDAAHLVRLYHEHRFKAADYVPKTHELSRATKLLKEHGFETLAGLAATVARTVERQFRGADLYFGSAVPHFENAAKLRQKQRTVPRSADQSERGPGHGRCRDHGAEAPAEIVAATGSSLSGTVCRVTTASNSCDWRLSMPAATLTGEALAFRCR